jgi:hypothetical protein
LLSRRRSVGHAAEPACAMPRIRPPASTTPALAFVISAACSGRSEPTEGTCQPAGRVPTSAAGGRDARFPGVRSRSQAKDRCVAGDRVRPRGGVRIEACDGPAMVETHRRPATVTRFCFVALAATYRRLLLPDSDGSKQKRAYPPRTARLVPVVRESRSPMRELSTSAAFRHFRS